MGVKLKIVLTAILVTLVFALNANAYVVNIYLDGLDETDIKLSMFQFSLLNDDTYGYPIENENLPGWPPQNKVDFFVEPGPGCLYPSTWDYLTINTAVNEKTFTRGLFGMPQGGMENIQNTLKDGLFLTMKSEETPFAVDTSSLLFWKYGTPDITKFEDVYDFKAISTIVGDTTNVNINFAPIPIPSSLLLLGGGLMALFGIRRRQ